MHINNLYKDQRILEFRWCYALEKVHGTSAHLSWNAGQLGYFGGGESYERFKALFEHEQLASAFQSFGHEKVIVYGEAYGGKQQGMRKTYGDELRFIVFDVKVGDSWLSVPDMQQVADFLGLEVVPWCKTPTDVSSLDRLRDLPSEVAVRRGCGTDRLREGVVLRPPFEATLNNGERIIAKHKGEAFAERAKTPQLVDPAKLVVLKEAEAIAVEWVTDMRLSHVLDKFPEPSIERMGEIIGAMVADIEREAEGEIVPSRAARAAIGKRTASLYKERLKATLKRQA